MQLFILKLTQINESGSVGRQLKALITANGVTVSFGFTGSTSRNKTIINGEQIGDQIIKAPISVKVTEIDPKYNDGPYTGSTTISISPEVDGAQSASITLSVPEIGGKGKNKGKTATLTFSFDAIVTCRKDNNVLTTSSEGLDFIKGIEGVRYVAYQDQAGHWTVGVGHRIRKGEEYLKTKTLTDAEVDALLASDLAASEKLVNSDIKACLKQNQFNALVSFAFNIGHLGDDLKKTINAKGSASAIRSAFLEYVYITDPKTHKNEVSTGLLNRRTAEADLYFS